MIETWETLKLLSDPTRLRIINLLSQEELSVVELQEILDMGQSRISSHLALLRQGELAVDRKDGKRSYYSLNSRLGKKKRQLISATCEAVTDSSEAKSDKAYLKRIIAKRRQVAEKYFNEVAGRLGKNYCPGRSWQAIGHFLLFLTPKIEIADLGAGEGMLSQLLAQRAKRVYCVDSSPKMVEIGGELAKKNGIDNLFYRLGDMETVPLKKESVDMAMFSQALHHAEHPQKALREAYRIIRPGGRVFVLDLKKHNFEKAREIYADRWLGFSQNSLYQFLKEAGFQKVEVNVVAKEEKEPCFETILATGEKAVSQTV